MALERSRAERLGESTGGGGLLSVVAPLDSVFSIHGGRSILACRPELGGWILLKYLSLGQIWSLESLYHFPLHLLPMVFVPPPISRTTAGAPTLAFGTLTPSTLLSSSLAGPSSEG